MKYFFLLFITVSFVNAETLYVKENRCIKDDYYFLNSRFYYTYSSTNNNVSSEIFKSDDLEFGYEYIEGKCQKIQILQQLGMTYQDYKLMTSLSGLLIGFALFITIIFIFIRRD